MLEKIVKQKIEPATYVLDSVQNIVFSNSKANSLFKNSITKKKLLQLSSLLVEQSIKKNKHPKITSIKVNKRNLSLQLEKLHLKKDKQTYYIVKIEDHTNVYCIDNTKLAKAEGKLELCNNRVQNYSKEINNIKNVTLLEKDKKIELVNKELFLNEKKYKAIFYNAFNFIARLSPNGIVLEHNRYGNENKAFRYIKDLIGKPIWTDKFLYKSSAKINQIKQDIKLCSKGSIVSNEIDYFFKGKENSIKLKYTLKPIYDAQKKVTWLLLEGINISDLKNTQSRLNKSLIKSE